MDLVSRGLKTKPIVGGLRINEIIKYMIILDITFKPITKF